MVATLTPILEKSLSAQTSNESDLFRTIDPIGFAGGDSNLYRYVGNNPTNGTDPSGLAWWEWIPIISTAGHYIATVPGEAVQDYAEFAIKGPIRGQADKEAAIKRCKDQINAKAAKNIGDWVGIPVGADIMKALAGGVAGLLGYMAIKTGTKGAVAGTLTGGLLMIDAGLDTTIVIDRIFKIRDAARAAQNKYCVC